MEEGCKNWLAFVNWVVITCLRFRIGNCKYLFLLSLLLCPTLSLLLGLLCRRWPFYVTHQVAVWAHFSESMQHTYPAQPPYSLTIIFPMSSMRVLFECSVVFRILSIIFTPNMLRYIPLRQIVTLVFWFLVWFWCLESMFSRPRLG